MHSPSLARAGVRFGRALLRTLFCLLGANLLCFVLLFMFYPAGGPIAAVGVGPATVGADSSSESGRVALTRPLLFNAAAGGSGQLTETLLFDRSVRILGGDFGTDALGREIVGQVAQRIGPSTALVGVPALLLLVTAGSAALGFVLIAARRNERIGVAGALMMALVFASVVLGGYALVARLFACLQSIGFGPGRLLDAGRPLLAVSAAVAGLAVALWWRQVALLPALRAGPARAARARGLPELKVCLSHGVVCGLPALRMPLLGFVSFLFMLSLMLETLFEVPGLGQYAVEAFHAGDVLVLHSLILLGVLMHLVGLKLAGLAFARFELPVAR